MVQAWISALLPASRRRAYQERSWGMPARLKCPYDLIFTRPMPSGFRLFLTPGTSPVGSLAQGTAGRVGPKYHFPGSREKFLGLGPGSLSVCQVAFGVDCHYDGVWEGLPKTPHHENILESALRTSSEFGSPDE